MCAPELMRQESTFLEYLNKVNSFEFLNEELLLIDPRGKLLVKAKRIKR
jgi:heat shock protein HslJ